MLGRRLTGGVGRRWKLEGGFEGGVYRDRGALVWECVI